ncbi:hypothetical protein AVKW3434_07710 [Acidovorax sp. SUPP3434]|uniref:hypothetical protein n=1 Tax=Acidovorax sp. SUPP3434 TaxID=2920880 RepID=UPI0023DE246A|nr:hypothetical protein [Acidovorax sp. SUPP3434]GKS99252.1 hypothetical protein AVKW3434_07710 [Acidovorax sp. SUPP3434]
MFARGLQAGRPFQGAPRHLLWDSSANTSAAVRSRLDVLEAKHITDEVGNSRAKGCVENRNNIEETQFESRLRFESVENVDQLNGAAFAWTKPTAPTRYRARTWEWTGAPLPRCTNR